MDTEWRVHVRDHLPPHRAARLAADCEPRSGAGRAAAWARFLWAGTSRPARRGGRGRVAVLRRRPSARHVARAIHCEDVLERWVDLASGHNVLPRRAAGPAVGLAGRAVGTQPRAAGGRAGEAALLLVAWHLDDRQLIDSDGARAVRRHLDALAARVRGAARDGGGDTRALRALLGVLFEEEGLAGNEGAYYDARNSLLDHVLRRRLGIPITLSLVVITVGARVGLQLDSVGLPGHFLLALRTDDGAPPTYIDAFRKGALLTEENCRAIVASYQQWAWSDDFLKPMPPPEVWQRMLRNLLNTCSRSDARAQHRLMQLSPGAPLAMLVRPRAPLTPEAHCRLWPVELAPGRSGAAGCRPSRIWPCDGAEVRSQGVCR